MKIVQINGYCEIGSTGKICVSISKILSASGIENYILYTQGKSQYSQSIKYGGEFFYTNFQSLRAKVFGVNGDCCIKITKKLINLLDKIRPTHVHLHNLHAQNINLLMLFNYLREKKVQVFWTFHDCWAFTGYCMHFENVGCYKWRTQCNNCPQKRTYSWFYDKSDYLFEIKRKFRELDMTIITPSNWMENYVRQSFFKDKKIITINNGINHNVFKKVKTKFKENHGITGKKVVLAVADRWNYKKGLDIIIKLSEMLNDNYKIVIVGTNKYVDLKLPKKICSIHRTDSQQKLVEIYSAADVFINPTREDTFPTVNLEALSCGLPVITNDVCGCKETVDVKSGYVVRHNDVDLYIKYIDEVCKFHRINPDCCVMQGMKFDQKHSYEKYLSLYRDIG